MQANYLKRLVSALEYYAEIVILGGALFCYLWIAYVIASGR
jgi:hypothetical protein